MAQASVSASPRRPKAAASRKANNQLHSICFGYHRTIPVSAIFEAARVVGEPLQEDGAPWQGFLCGREGRADIDLEGSRLCLHFQWYRLESGNYEVNAYIA